MTSFAFADEVESIDFIRYFHDLETEGDLYVSWAGGAVIEFKGEGFDDTPVANSIYFRTTGLGGDVTVPGSAMTGKFLKQINSFWSNFWSYLWYFDIYVHCRH